MLELIEGPTLADRIAQGPIPVDDALAIAGQIADALEATHEQGVIHRDLKPANIKITPDGDVKVLDFGLAKALDPTTTDASASLSPTISLTAAATQLGMVIGTAAYMSPEQARGKPVDKRADIWAFGVVLYEMLSGTRPFQGEDVSLTLASVMKSGVDVQKLPSDLPATVRTALDRCLEKDPKQRIRDIGDVRLSLEGKFASATTVASGQGEGAQGATLRLWQRPAPALFALLLVGGLAGLVGWMARPAEPKTITRFQREIPPSLPPSTAVLDLSPDGREFVYNTFDGLYLGSLDSLEANLLPGTEGVRARGPVFSPDGRSLAFRGREEQSSSVGNYITRLDLGGGTPVLVADQLGGMGELSWTDDGRILYGGGQGLMQVPATGGTPEVLVEAGEDELLGQPRLLPDGESVLFTVGSRTSGWDDPEIAVQSLTTGERTTLFEGHDARYVSTGHLVYALNDGLFAVAFDPVRLAVEGGAVSLVPGGATAGEVGNYAISNDGTLIHLSGLDAARGAPIWMDRSGAVEVIAAIPPNEYSSPRLSPDGARLLVVAEGDVWIYDLATGREQRVTRDGSVGQYYADWTPSGSEVVYSSTRDGSEDVWIQPLDGSGDARKLTDLEGNVHFESWAPDGRTFAAHLHPRDGSAVDLLMVQPDAGELAPEPWLDRPFQDNGAVFSPDGRYVAYVSGESGQREVQIRPFPGPGGQQTVSIGGGEDIVWASTGELVYTRPDGVLMAVDISTAPELEVGEVREILRVLAVIEGTPRANYTVSADGSRFLVPSLVAAAASGPGESAPTTSVVVTLNWVEELKERVPTP